LHWHLPPPPIHGTPASADIAGSCRQYQPAFVGPHPFKWWTKTQRFFLFEGL